MKRPDIREMTYTTRAIFPTPILSSDLSENFTEEELIALANLKTRKNIHNTTSVNNYVLEAKEFNKLKTFIEKALKHYMTSVLYAHPTIELYITQSWINYTEQGQSHHKHRHSNSFISGVFYLSASDEEDKIEFYSDKYEQIKIPYVHPNVFNIDSFLTSVKTGELIIFPSSLSHAVLVKNQVSTRISLAFNTFLKGTIGDNLGLSELILK